MSIKTNIKQTHQGNISETFTRISMTHSCPIKILQHTKKKYLFIEASCLERIKKLYVEVY